mgnify:CR=1 FL=1
MTAKKNGAVGITKFYETLLTIQREGEERERRIMLHFDTRVMELKAHVTSNIANEVKRLDIRVDTQESRTDAVLKESRWTSFVAAVFGGVAGVVAMVLDRPR